MRCNCCEQDYPEKDFFLNQIDCFRCVYKRKLGNKKKDFIKKCPICNGSIYNNNKIVYCSTDCAAKGNEKVRHERYAYKYVGGKVPFQYFGK